MAAESERKHGRLYVVATPLGNLEDITHRAVRILGEVELVAAEDTRRTRKLLSSLDLRVKMVSYRAENHRQALPGIMRVLENGGDVALTTDAGTPAVSDPGRLLTEEAHRAGLEVVPIPGPSAVAAALSASGLPADRYMFAGFPPSKKKARAEFLASLAGVEASLVFFEAPHRLAKSLADMADAFGPRPAVLCREMTKINEEIRPGTLDELAGWAAAGEPRGEATLVVSGAEPAGPDEGLSRDELKRIVAGDERPVREIAAELSKKTALSRSELYRLILDVREEADSDNPLE